MLKSLCGGWTVQHHGLCNDARVPDRDPTILQEPEQLPSFGLERVLVCGLFTEQFGRGPITRFG